MKHSVAAIKVKRIDSKGFKSFAGIIILFSVIFLSLFACLRYVMESIKVRQEQYQELCSLEKELERLKAENKKRQEIVDKLNKYEFIEIIARQKFGLVKPGEKLYIVIKPYGEEEKSESDNLQFEKDLLDLTKER